MQMTEAAFLMIEVAFRYPNYKVVIAFTLPVTL